jgi:hypothetical protein
MTQVPLQFLLVLQTGWLSRHQQDVSHYLQDESRVLKKSLTGHGEEVYYHVVRDDDFGPEWQIRLLFVPVLPFAAWSRKPLL